MNITPTQEQLAIIDTLIKAGYGWKKYAESVSKQSHLTQAQVNTLYSMYNKLRNQQSAAEMRSQWKPKMSTYADKHIASLDMDEVGDWGYVDINN